MNKNYLVAVVALVATLVMNVAQARPPVAKLIHYANVHNATVATMHGVPHQPVRVWVETRYVNVMTPYGVRRCLQPGHWEYR